MDGLLEFVFESVPEKKVGAMIENVVGSVSNMIDITHNEIDGYLDNYLVMSHKFWESISTSSSDVVYYLNIKRLKINNLFVVNGSIRVIHYDMKTEIAIMLSSTDCKAVNLRTSQEFYFWAKNLANTFDIVNYYGGLDPASDEDTQLYSDKGVGLITEI